MHTKKPPTGSVASSSFVTRLRSARTPLLFLGPAFVLILLFFILPVLVTIGISFTDLATSTFGGRASFVGLANFERMYISPYTAKIFTNTITYVVCTLVVFNVGLALVISLLTTSMNKTAGSLFRSLWLLPRITPSVIYIIMWQYILADQPSGILSQVVTALGGEARNWLYSYPMVACIVANGFIGTSFGMIIFTSALESIPPEYVIAARVDGASALQIIRRIKLPLIRWPLLFVTAYQTLSLLTSFEQILLLTNGGPGFYTTEVWALYAYHTALSNYWGNSEFGFGSAL
ncbi:MAG: sugar ABC transporter permease, partial [Chloroflexota bacterium]|nr:sugar ABC transporter permease [Chloroflexota bacterium]